MRRCARFAAIVLLLAAAGRTPAQAAPVAPPDFVVENAFPTAVFLNPVAIAFLPDGRYIVAEIAGRAWMVHADGTRAAVPFLDIRNEVAGFSDLGMLGLAIDPDFSTNRWVYFGYTVDPNGDGVENDEDRYVRVTRYQVSLGNPDVADAASRQVLIGSTWSTGIVTTHTTHTIGSLRFAADKSLIVSCGEGAHWEVADRGNLDSIAFNMGNVDPAENIGAFRAQTLNSMAGKVLRIDKETGLGLPSNPYWTGDASDKESRIWLYGLRNPFRFCIRPGTGSTLQADGDPGTLYIGDVGLDTYEELNIAPGPEVNFGWPCIEGPFVHALYDSVQATHTGNTNVLCGAAPSAENPEPYTTPDLWWHHTNGANSFPVGWTGETAIGGSFYTGTSYPPAYQGRYYIGDWTFGWIRAVQVDAADNILGWSEFITNADGPVAIEVNPFTGDLWYIALFTSEVRRIRYTGAVDAPVVATPAGVPSVEAFPNPFRGATSIRFDLPRAGRAELSIHDVAGRRVRTLAGGRFDAGAHFVPWDGKDERGGEPAGVFFYRLETDDGVRTGKVTPLR